MEAGGFDVFKALLAPLFKQVFFSFRDKADVTQKIVLIVDVVRERVCKFTLS